MGSEDTFIITNQIWISVLCCFLKYKLRGLQHTISVCSTRLHSCTTERKQTGGKQEQLPSTRGSTLRCGACRGVHENIASASFQNTQNLVYSAKQKITTSNEGFIVDPFISLPKY